MRLAMTAYVTVREDASVSAVADAANRTLSESGVVYAIGDVNNLPIRENPTAGREGTLATQNALTGTRHSIAYDHVPTTVFTDPQLASVGVTEAEQIGRIGDSDCRTVSFENVPKAVITRRTDGLIHMVTHPDTEQIVGVHILAPDAGDLIAEAMMLVTNRNTITDVVNSAPMYPTLSEAIKIVALSYTKDITKLCCSY
jgi:mercuric reductase